jgi:hypothetical protein
MGNRSKKGSKKGSKKSSNKPAPVVQLVQIDLACGQNKRAGFTGVDRVAMPGVDIVHDLETYPWPFADNSVDEVHCSHFVEHIRDLNAFMNELHRVMKVGAHATVIAPYYTSVRASQDPTHVRFISEQSFLYYNKAWRVANGLSHYPINCDFDFTYGYAILQEWAQREENARLFAIAHYWNVVTDIQLVLTKREPAP